MNQHLIKTLARMREKGYRAEERRIFLDVYNRRWLEKFTGTIDTGVDFRCQLFIMEYDEADSPERG